ncbi:MAG: DUF2945 domain-containing protein [Pseudomonas fluorescens]|nr:MAG: DUF2945 domain-containing protein [Pseudomonas fluorescens]
MPSSRTHVVRPFTEGTPVTWNWGAHQAHGVVAEVFTEAVTRTIKGTSVTRKATPANPAYLVVQEKGTQALKSHSELSETM